MSEKVPIYVFDIVFMRYIFLQQVLTHVLEESGYTKDSLLSISDFMKVLQHYKFCLVINARYCRYITSLVFVLHDLTCMIFITPLSLFHLSDCV